MQRFALCALTVLSASPLLFAQAFQSAGSGCGIQGRTLHRFNPDPQASSMSNSTGPNEYSYPVNVASTVVTVCTGVRFFTRSLGGYKTVEARIYVPDTNTPSQPSTTPLDVAKLTIGPNAQYWTANFNKPHVMTGPFWVSFDNYDTYTSTTQGPSVVSASNLSTGTTITPVYWRRPNYNSFNWTTTSSVSRPSFDVLTAGNPAPLMTAKSGPMLGQNYQLDVSQAPNGPAVVILGFSNATWGAIPMPLDLDALAPGCAVFQSLDFLIPSAVGGGTGMVQIPIPNDKVFVNAVLYNQWLFFAPGANAFGWLMSNSGEGTIG